LCMNKPFWAADDQVVGLAYGALLFGIYSGGLMLSLMPSHELLTIAGLLAMALGMECSPVTAEVTHNSYNCFSFTFSDCTSFRVFTVLAGVCWLCVCTLVNSKSLLTFSDSHSRPWTKGLTWFVNQTCWPWCVVGRTSFRIFLRNELLLYFPVTRETWRTQFPIWCWLHLRWCINHRRACNCMQALDLILHWSINVWAQNMLTMLISAQPRACIW